MNLNGKRRQAVKKVETLEEFFRISGRKKPAPFAYGREDAVSLTRALYPEEERRLLGLIIGNDERWRASEKDETRCAAAYVAAHLGLVAAKPIMEAALASGVDSPHVEYAFGLAVSRLALMEELKTRPEDVGQLSSLLEMRVCGRPAEQRFADLIIRKAGIKYE